MKPFPINYLNDAVTNVLSKIVTIDIANGIEKGLDPMIHFADEYGGPINSVAEIHDNPIHFPFDMPQRHVTISIAYAQMLWMLCSIALRNHDSIAVEIELSGMSKDELDIFYQELQVDSNTTIYLRELLDKKKTFDKSAEMLNYMEALCQRHLTEEEMDYLYSLDMTSEIGVKINSMYIFAMAFNLLHEFSHHSLNHDFQNDGCLQEEVEADSNAFWSIYNDLDGAEKNTAMMGILCSLISLIFNNRSLSDDGIHPLPIERIFTYYDLIKEENPKYAGLLCHLFYVWAVFVHDDDMPKWDGPYDETLDKIKEHMLAKEHNE